MYMCMYNSTCTCTCTLVHVHVGIELFIPVNMGYYHTLNNDFMYDCIIM